MISTIIGTLDHTWHYAGWVSVDVRLLLFLVMLSVVGSVGTTAILGRERTRVELAAIFIVSFCALLAILVLIFNQLASYPVFVVDAFFPFP